jgi:hypothetical protein
MVARGVASACRLWLIGWSGTGQCLEGRLMHWRRRLAALLVALALAGCAQGTTGQPAGSNASHPSENNEIRPEHGGGDGGGGGGGM